MSINLARDISALGPRIKLYSLQTLSHLSAHVVNRLLRETERPSSHNF